MSCENEDLASLTPEQLEKHRRYHQGLLIAAAFQCPSFICAGSFDFSYCPNFVARYQAGRINRIAEVQRANPTVRQS